MAESPYRGEYGVEDRVREPNAEERALIEERRGRQLAIRRRIETGGARSVLVMALVGLLGGILAGLFGKHMLALGAFGFVLLFGILGQLAYRRGVARARAHVGRWGAPPERWRAREARIRARSVVYAASEDEDYTTWLLYEIPGDEWAAIDDLWIPADRRGDLARDDLTITWLEPANECTGVEVRGGLLPKRGAVQLSDPDYEDHHFAQAIEDGYGWPAEDQEETLDESPTLETSPIRRIPEDELPPWVRGVEAKS